MHNIDKFRKSNHGISKTISLATFQELITDAEIQTICRRTGHTWRQRLLPPPTMIRSMVYRSLHTNKSIKTLLTDIAAMNLESQAPTDAAWCRARSKLPAELWHHLMQLTESRLSRLVGHKYLYCGLPVFIIDGSTVSMPDEPELAKTFGYANTKHGLSRFPVARMTFIVRLGTQAVCAYEMGHYRTSEDAQFNRMWPQLPSHSICLFDKKFCSFYNLAKLQQRHISIISPLHQKRNPYQLIKGGKSIGKNQWIVFLQLAPQLRKRYDDNSLPLQLPVRLIHVKFRRNGKPRHLWLVTTLLDGKKYPRSSIIKLYRQRWKIETRIGSLKTTLQMDVLRSKTVKNVCSEVAAAVLAHNLVWTVIHRASQQAGIRSERISFTGAARTVLAFSICMQTIETSERHSVYRAMLYHIARQVNPYRPNRIEPRLVKRQTRRYGFLKIPRDKARLIA